MSECWNLNDNKKLLNIPYMVWIKNLYLPLKINKWVINKNVRYFVILYVWFVLTTSLDFKNQYHVTGSLSQNVFQANVLFKFFV